MAAGLLAALLLAAPAADADTVAGYWPCTPGISVRYRVLEAGKDTGARVTETVRGPKPPRLCVIERVTERPGAKPETERHAFEMLDDRVLYAGFADTPIAFRPPLMKAPLQRGKRWTFQRVAYRIEEIGTTFDTPAGTFQRCLRISEKAFKGPAHEGYAVYAFGVGPIVKVAGGRTWIAEKVVRGEAEVRGVPGRVGSKGPGRTKVE